MSDWPTKSNPRSPGRAQRERNRISIQLEGNEKPAIHWLSRCPKELSEKLPTVFRPLRGCPARVIAKALSGREIENLTEFYSKLRQPPPSQNSRN